MSIRDSVASGAAFTGSYLFMNVAATLIPGFGLLGNSPAVIIGEMVIAKPYGPIIGIAMGFAEVDLALLRRSLVSEVVGVGCVVAIAFVVGMPTRDFTIGSEVLNRASANLLDWLIALVGGLAGRFVFVSTGLTGVIVGVTIAAALVPPLTTFGIMVEVQ